jgi:hypothetical protein
MYATESSTYTSREHDSIDSIPAFRDNSRESKWQRSIDPHGLQAHCMQVGEATARKGINVLITLECATNLVLEFPFD